MQTKKLSELQSLRRTYSIITLGTCYALVLGSEWSARVALGVTVFIWILALSALQADIRRARQPKQPDGGSISGETPETARHSRPLDTDKNRENR